MKKIKTILLLMFICFFLVSCRSETLEIIYLDQAFSIVPTLYLTGSKSDIKKYKNEIKEKASKIVSDLDSYYSVDNENSYVYKINQNAGIRETKVSSECIYILEKAIEISNTYTPKYDISIYPLSLKWDFMNNYFNGDNYKDAPSEEEVNEAKEKVDYTKIVINEKNVYLSEGMMIDLGSIVKGYACDKIASMLNMEYDSFSYIIDVGGNIYTKGMGIRNNKKDKFHIGIQTPFFNDKIKDIDDESVKENGYYLGYIEAPNDGVSVVTSGIYERYIKDSNGVMYHHILDKETGYPILNDIESLTVILKEKNSSITADALSTALFCLGKDRAIEMAKENNLSIIIATKDKKVYTYLNGIDFRENDVVKKMGYEYIVGNNQ